MSVLTQVGADFKLAKEIIEDLEWSDTVRGPGSYMGARDGSLYDCCPLCGGLEKENSNFDPSAVGHRSGCRIALFLKRPTEISPGETGKLAL